MASSKFEFEPARADGAFKAKRSTETVLEAELLLDGAPYNLTGFTGVRVNVAREDPPYSGTLVNEISAHAGSITNAPLGLVSATLSAVQMNIPEGDHLVMFDIMNGATVADRVPRGMSYLRLIVGKAIGT